MPEGQRALAQQDIIHKSARAGCEEDDTISKGCDARAMEPFGAAASSIAVIGSIARTASAAKTLYSNYREAEEDSQHIQKQREHLKINQSLLQSHRLENPDQLNGINVLFTNLEAALPSQPCSAERIDKFTWAALGGKRKAQDKITKLKEIESSTSVTLQFLNLGKM